MPQTESGNACTQCGACCAAFRVSFYWSEAGRLPAHLTEQLSPHLACMAGSNQASPRCAALDGAIGEEVACRVYAERPSPCREVQPGDAKCITARARYGLLPLAEV